MGIVFFDLDLLELYYVTINPKSCTTNLSQPIKPHFEYVAKMHKPKWSHRDFINKSDGVKYLDSFASFWGKKKQKNCFASLCKVMKCRVFLVQVQTVRHRMFLSVLEWQLSLFNRLFLVKKKLPNYISFRKALDEIFQWFVKGTLQLWSLHLSL